MTARTLSTIGTACCAVAFAAPALAQPEMTYEPRTYEYAQPAPGDGAVVYEREPVVQPYPQQPASPVYTTQPVVQPLPRSYDDHEAEYEPQYTYEPSYPEPAPQDDAPRHGAPQHALPAHAPPHRAAPYPAPPYHAAPYQAARPGYAPLPADFDREMWLDDCREGYRNPRRRGDGGVAGGLLGAVVGGVIGNRVADGERLAGSLIGAGIGGLAGLAIGSAIASSGERRRDRDAYEACEAWLDRYLANGYGHPAYPAPNYGPAHGAYGYGYPAGHAMHMTFVPVLVAVPQRAVVRETIREEWVEEAAPTYKKGPAKRVIQYRKAPAPKKRAKYSKSR